MSINTSIETNKLHKGSSCASPRGEEFVLLNNGNYCATCHQHIFSNPRTKCLSSCMILNKKKKIKKKIIAIYIASVVRMDILLSIPKEEVACLIRQISHFNTSRLSGEVSEPSPELIAKQLSVVNRHPVGVSRLGKTKP